MDSQKQRDSQQNVLRQKIYGAWGKNQIIDRETNQPVANLDPSDVWENPERFLIGAPIERGMSELDRMKGEVKRSTAGANWARAGWYNRRGTGDGEGGADSPFAREWREIATIEERTTAANKEPSDEQLADIDSRRRTVTAAERAFFESRASGDPISPAQARAMARNTIDAIEALRGLITRNNLQGDPSVNEHWDYRNLSAIRRLRPEVRQIINGMYRSTSNIFEALHQLEHQAGDVITPTTRVE
jgi:hypothetical protein